MEEPDDEFPLYLTTGRVMAQYQSGTQTRRVAALMSAAPEAFVQIHPSMARTYGIAEGDRVSLTTRRGTAEMKAQLTSLHPHGYRVRSFSLRRIGARQPADQSRAGSDFAKCPNSKFAQCVSRKEPQQC